MEQQASQQAPLIPSCHSVCYFELLFTVVVNVQLFLYLADRDLADLVQSKLLSKYDKNAMEYSNPFTSK